MFKEKNRREFLQKSITPFLALPILGKINYYKEGSNNKIYAGAPRIKIGVVGINHGHIYSMVQAVVNGGAELVSFYALEDNLAADFQKRFPNAKRVKDAKEVFENKDLQMILSSAIPVDRAQIAITAMKNGKDVMVDKPGLTTLAQLKAVKKVQAETGRIFSICYSERFENRATERATTLVQQGAIGKVVQTIGTGPHRMNAPSRPEWFFDKKYFGGVITDIASHQFDQFLHFTGSTSAKVLSSQVGNLANLKHPEFEDFGDVMLKGDKGSGYIRVDWFTPNGLKTWGDGKLIILGTEGYIEIRKNIDINRTESGSHLYLVNQKETAYIDVSQQTLPYGQRLVDDVVNRTDTAMSQAHCFLAMELALKAQKSAIKIS